MSADDLSLETKLIHAGADEAAMSGAVVTPIFQSSTYASRPDETSYEDVRYLRLNNSPNHETLHRRLAALEGADDALVVASGMAAISTTLLTVLEHGDHLLASACLYGGTLALMNEELPAIGVEVDFIDPDHPERWEELLRPTTRALYVEPMSNPLLQVADLDALTSFAHDNELTAVIDNTFCSPVNLRPLEVGFDLVVHSATKYLNGHSDIVAGAIAGQRAWLTRIRRRLNHMGACLDPHAAFLLERGLKTLALRVRHQNASALALARALEVHPAVRRVNYPGLDSHPQHDLARAQFEGFGGVLSFELDGDIARAERFIDALELATFAPSLGGPETLVTLPSRTSHASIPADQRRALGIADALVRVSVGLEGTLDLIEDFTRALGR